MSYARSLVNKITERVGIKVSAMFFNSNRHENEISLKFNGHQIVVSDQLIDRNSGKSCVVLLIIWRYAP